jgi:nitric oxide reductase NorQ protein
MILLQTSIEGTSYQVRPLKNQKFESTLTVPLEDLQIKATVADFARFPLGTVFFCEIEEMSAGNEIFIPKNSTVPVYFDETVFPLTAENKKEIWNHIINYMLDNPEIGVDTAKKFAGLVKTTLSVNIDIEEMLTPKIDESTGKMEAGANFRRSLSSMYPAPKVEDCGFQVDHDKWYLMVRNVLRGENTMLVGPTGSGKTEIIALLAKAMSKELNIQDMGTVQDAQSALLGVHRLNKEGHSEFEFAPFISHVQTGGLVLLDELNRSPLAANNILFPALDKRRYIPIDIACESCERKINIHPDTVFFATANLGAEYSGTQAIDRALLDRFMPIELDYPREAEEIRVLMLRTGVAEKQAKAIVKVANEIRKQSKEQELSNAISVRHTLQAASLIADGFETDKSLLAVIMPLFEDGIGVSERSKVLSIVSAF